MVNLTEFIKLERHDPLITKLDEAVKRKKICTLLGPAGSGKTWLIDYWLRTSERLPEAVQSNQAVYIRLRPATETSLPMTCVVYSRIWHELRQLDRAAYVRDDVRDEQELYNSEIKVYNSRQLQTLLLKVIDKASRKNIRVVVIDDAHHLDKTAVEWLLDLHTYYDEQRGLQPHRAIVLVGRDDKNLLSHLKNI
jgi:type II secretory pathway predicted ATPase ExeA